MVGFESFDFMTRKLDLETGSELPPKYIAVNVQNIIIVKKNIQNHNKPKKTF